LAVPHPAGPVNAEQIMCPKFTGAEAFGSAVSLKH